MFSYNNFVKNRKKFLKENSNEDFVYFDNDSKILLSAPHGVPQTRLGKKQHEEPGSLAFALELYKRLNCNFIAKTKNNFDDVNFDQHSPYKTQIARELEKTQIGHIIDFHGLSSKRDMDVNFGINFGNNIKRDEKLFDKLLRAVKKAGFVCSIDNPFCGNPATIAGTFNDRAWTIQIELNSKITNNPQARERLSKLLDIFEKWLKEI